MFINIDAHCFIFFGDASSCPVSFKDPHFKSFCDHLRQNLHLEKLALLHQVHGIDGWYIKDKNELKEPVVCNERDGDFLITNQQEIGIGVSTADCLPIIFYEPHNKLIAVAHAGWRGSVANICSTVLDNMDRGNMINRSGIHVYFGPAARSCCYEVKQDFIEQNKHLNLKDPIISKQNTRHFFDNTLLNKRFLIECGIKPENINTEYNLCTICNHKYHSYRRQQSKGNYQSQTTVAWLKK